MLSKLRFSLLFTRTWNFAYDDNAKKVRPPWGAHLSFCGGGGYCPSMPLLTPRVVPITVRRVMMVCITFFHTCFFIGC